jgi:hypothetical protein
MQKATFKISALILCGLLIYNSLGYLMVFSLIRISMQKQKWAQISTIPVHQLTAFVFEKQKPNSRLKIVNKREIEVDGKLYDIARMVDDGKSITYYCVYDKKEEKLIANSRLLNSMAQPVPVKNTTSLIIDNIIKTAVFDYQINGFCFERIQHNTPFAGRNYSVPDIFILVPPPQTCC